jgi:hypothetical protein
MAKRQRGTGRPGQRRPVQRVVRRSAPDVAVRPSASLTADEEARAAEIEAQLLAQERVADEQLKRSRERARDADARLAEPALRGRDLQPLSVRAAGEYAYVRRDVLRITRIGGALIGVLAVLHILINVLHLFAL